MGLLAPCSPPLPLPFAPCACPAGFLVLTWQLRGPSRAPPIRSRAQMPGLVARRWGCWRQAPPLSSFSSGRGGVWAGPPCTLKPSILHPRCFQEPLGRHCHPGAVCIRVGPSFPGHPLRPFQSQETGFKSWAIPATPRAPWVGYVHLVLVLGRRGTPTLLTPEDWVSRPLSLCPPLAHGFLLRCSCRTSGAGGWSEKLQEKGVLGPPTVRPGGGRGNPVR